MRHAGEKLATQSHFHFHSSLAGNGSVFDATTGSAIDLSEAVQRLRQKRWAAWRQQRFGRGADSSASTTNEQLPSDWCGVGSRWRNATRSSQLAARKSEDVLFSATCFPI